MGTKMPLICDSLCSLILFFLANQHFEDFVLFVYLLVAAVCVLELPSGPSASEWASPWLMTDGLYMGSHERTWDSTELSHDNTLSDHNSNISRVFQGVIYVGYVLLYHEAPPTCATK